MFQRIRARSLDGSRSRLLPVLAVAAVVGSSAACYPGSISDLGETDLVFTLYDTTTSFGGFSTYVMPDSIVRLGDGGEEDVDRTYDADVLAEIASQLDAIGYTRVDETAMDPPDLVILVGVSSSTYEYWIDSGWWGRWGWYPWGPWWPGWGPPYYPRYPVYGGSFQTGSLLVTMLAPDEVSPADPEEEIPVVWAGAVNGVLSRSTEVNLVRLQGLIRQMFVQSPYLGR